jgi:hypothetical protein
MATADRSKSVGMFTTKTGDYLPNGSLVIKAAGLVTGPDAHPSRTVLAHKGESDANGRQDWAVWTLVYPPGRPAYCVSGDYYPNLESALAGYKRRNWLEGTRA